MGWRGGVWQLDCEDRVMRMLRIIYCSSKSTIVGRPAFPYIHCMARDVDVETPQTDVACTRIRSVERPM